MEYANWQQGLIDCIIELQHKLEDSKQKIGDNEEVNKIYFETLTKVVAAREAINHFAWFYNKGYA